MNDHRRCATCGEWGWFGNRVMPEHRCPPTWEARLFDPKDRECWTEVHANDAEGAAAKFAEQHDQDGDYDIIQRGGAEIQVRKRGEAIILIVDVDAESVPHYYGHVRSEQPVPSHGHEGD